MLDQKLLRAKLDEIIAALKKRGFVFDRALYEELEKKRKTLQTKVETLQAERNAKSKTIGQAKAQGKPTEELMRSVEAVNAALGQTEGELRNIQVQLDEFLAQIPNIVHESVPEGKDSESNREIRRVGEITQFNFKPETHEVLGVKRGWFDFEAAAKLSGARFIVIRGALARMHRALIQFMFDIHTREHGYTEVYVPYLVNQYSMYGTGQLPKFKADHFHIAETDGRQGMDRLSLIPTAEVPVTNLVRDLILRESDLPLKWVCHTPCFRSEVGAYGRDTSGIMRQHQFEKVELVKITTPEKSYEELEKLTNDAEMILKRLSLPYRVMMLCSGDTGFSSAKTYDLEVWLPGQNQYREISSCSNFESFQARRMQARFRRVNTQKIELIHTLNGSGLAVGRTLIAIMENYQDADGHICVPRALQPYMEGIEKI